MACRCLSLHPFPSTTTPASSLPFRRPATAARASLPHPNPHYASISKLASAAQTSSGFRPENAPAPPRRRPSPRQRPKRDLSPREEQQFSANVAAHLFKQRVICITNPLVSAVSEMIIKQLLFLQSYEPEKPIRLYISSTGTTRDDGEPVALDSEGFAIYDIMMLSKDKIETSCLRVAHGHACLILAAGVKGKRSMLPHSEAMIHGPVVPSSGLMNASDLKACAAEANYYKNKFIKLFAWHTGNSEEVVAKKMERQYYMDGTQAIEFGVIDKIYQYSDLALDSPGKPLN